MKITEYRCDRCNAVINQKVTHVVSLQEDDPVYQPPPPARRFDLCNDCLTKLNRFLQNEDQVGDSYFEYVPAKCPHNIPCAGPCSYEWVPVRRLASIPE